MRVYFRLGYAPFLFRGQIELGARPVRLILTHNNADFDAIASLLAMTKLDPQATPVLPSRVNRNVRNFLTLYASLLPAIHEEDLTRHPKIERAYVVDTQTIANMRGIRPKTPVHVIDHHAPNPDRPPNYEFEGEPLSRYYPTRRKNSSSQRTNQFA